MCQTTVGQQGPAVKSAGLAIDTSWVRCGLEDTFAARLVQNRGHVHAPESAETREGRRATEMAREEDVLRTLLLIDGERLVANRDRARSRRAGSVRFHGELHGAVACA